MHGLWPVQYQVGKTTAINENKRKDDYTFVVFSWFNCNLNSFKMLYEIIGVLIKVNPAYAIAIYKVLWVQQLS